jgi:hypothetical protein
MTVNWALDCIRTLGGHKPNFPWMASECLISRQTQWHPFIESVNGTRYPKSVQLMLDFDELAG